MRVFKHGDALAVVFPQSAVSSSELKEGDELEFIETEKGVFVLLRKEKLAELAKSKVDSALERNFDKPFVKPLPAVERGSLYTFFKRELDSKGFVVVFEEKAAQDFSRDFESEIKSGALIGSRGFDKKFYVATRYFVQDYGAKASKVLSESPLSMQQIAEKLKLSEDGAKVLLSILMEQGEVIEKKKGVYASA